MPSSHTKNYDLNQWVKTDKVLMEDFNADNVKIDDAIKAVDNRLTTVAGGKADQSALDGLKQTVTSHTAALDGKGNCQIYTTSYTGTGAVGVYNPNKLTFPGKPAVVFIGERSGQGTTLIAFYGQTFTYSHNSSYTYIDLTWSENTMSWSNDTSATGQLNLKDKYYDVVALIEL